ncbi:hypothetical protein A2V61_00405 [Candidatus Woesebacteria bacterium RBG_19FT_COMBO_47_8]|uniref:Uncharacterized protein n=1 Tax=Candidatus Woesebacteria bacterium RBG_13_46_13 TaxID=1802479 RepID=A0A1F7X3B2_9BACT|nr:MAG: hypothetical protein A2Y68_03005 [Candidatus Woesebacteria bacterium RBG_13_46_13]OGM18161.1 MAG: hypothetical protein A2V61_00405 [Candidatus Woesebacteria bacterium RBG_19FT_COMBO_47_8]HJX59529.1 hypothetical protein [Patescibacteria group bacterium]
MAKKAFSPIIIVVVVIAVLALGGFLLVKSGKISLPGVGQVATRATEKDFASISDPLLRKHFVAQSNVNAVRMVSTSSGKGTKDTTEYQIKGEDFLYRMKEEDGDKEISQMIIIGDTSYVKDYSDSKWWKQVSKPEEVMTEEKAATPDDIKQEFQKEDPTLYKSLGTEACGSLSCHKYEQTFKDSPGTRTFWFDTKKYLLRKETSAYGEFSNEIEYSYDGISISAPSPTKDVPEGRNIYEYYLNPQSGNSASPTNVPTFNPSDYSVPTDIPTEVTIPPDSGGDY